MKAVLGEDIKKIDDYAESVLRVDTYTLMGRAGNAVADAVRANMTDAGYALFLAGAGNNGGDAYAAAVALIKSGLRAVVIDVTGQGQRSDAGKRYLAEYTALSGEVPKTSSALSSCISSASVIVDGVFGAGFHGKLPTNIADLLTLASGFPKKRIAIDVPSGVNASTGEASAGSFVADLTVMLSFHKRGAYMSPARLFCGEIAYSDIGLDTERIASHFGYRDNIVDGELARRLLPPRAQNANKGDLGRTVIFAGSEKYRGAPLLAAEAAARVGCGYTFLFSKKAVTDIAVLRQPSLIVKATDNLSRPAVLRAIEEMRPTALLIGCGSGVSEALYEDITALLARSGCPLILDADALTSLALFPDDAKSRLASAKREVLLTPHPLEFSRLSGIPVDTVQEHRCQSLLSYQEKCKVNITLKGYCTMTVAKNSALFINTSGGSALAKAGSGDVLAGAIAGLAASGMSLAEAACLAAYLHGKAGDRLKDEYSEYGVLPEELPKAIAKEIAAIQSGKE